MSIHLSSGSEVNHDWQRGEHCSSHHSISHKVPVPILNRQNDYMLLQKHKPQGGWHVGQYNEADCELSVLKLVIQQPLKSHAATGVN